MHQQRLACESSVTSEQGRLEFPGPLILAPSSPPMRGSQDERTGVKQDRPGPCWAPLSTIRGLKLPSTSNWTVPRARLCLPALLIAMFMLGSSVSVPAANRRLDSPGSSATKECRVGAPAPHWIGVLGLVGLIELRVPATIIGCGRSGAGPVELIAFETMSRRFCFGVLPLKLGSIQGVECKASGVTWESVCPGLCITSASGGGWTRRRGFRVTVVGGLAPPALSAIEAIGGRGVRHQQVPAVLGQMTGALLERFEQPEPFLVFGSVLPVCVAARTVSAVAQGEDGQVASIGRHIPDVFRHPCHPPPPSLNSGQLTSVRRTPTSRTERSVLQQRGLFRSRSDAMSANGDDDEE